ncbi:bifunctional DNA primase/polymerase [Streptomyces zingiberis]|uniref:DNA primase/polymerase bifunctional N-terminal domain-containing protein n=1 Tax=Streptomyces zingiberis TaxID=2053010 RepID=A0ABX1C154_9ACTN|nr:hypothetical protein [Streptomyces zingiberis]
MSDWQPRAWQHSEGPSSFALFRAPAAEDPSLLPARANAAGAAWLASAAEAPQRVLAHWSARPGAPVHLPCGTAFDVVSAPGVFGRRMLDRLWSEGPGTGPVAVHRGRLLLFTAPGTARRLPARLAAEEWADLVPPLLCHGRGDMVTVPPPGPPAREASGTTGTTGTTGIDAGTDGAARTDGGAEPPPPAPAAAETHTGATATAGAPGTAVTTGGAGASPDGPAAREETPPSLAPPADPTRPAPTRWLVAPDVRTPWLPGDEALHWACARAVLAGAGRRGPDGTGGPGRGPAGPLLAGTGSRRR